MKKSISWFPEDSWNFVIVICHQLWFGWFFRQCKQSMNIFHCFESFLKKPKTTKYTTVTKFFATPQKRKNINSLKVIRHKLFNTKESCELQFCQLHEMKYFFPNKLFGHTPLTVCLEFGISENLFHSDFQATNQAEKKTPNKKITKVLPAKLGLKCCAETPD